MKHDTLLLPKFKRLARMLGGSVPAAGTLEVLWRTCDSIQRFTFSAEEVEDVCEWDGDRGRLVEMLTACRWLDKEGDFYVVHDYLENAPEFIQERHRKRAEYNRRFLEKRGGNRRNAENGGESPEFSGPTDTDTDTRVKKDGVKNADTERVSKGAAQGAGGNGSGSVSGSADSHPLSGKGSPEAVGSVLDRSLNGGKGRDAKITAKAASIVAWTGEPPQYVDWWGAVIRKALALEIWGEVAEHLDYAESCVRQGKLKDLGELTRPGAYVASRITPIFHRAGGRLPRAPVARGGAGGALRTGT